ncbi:MAG: SEC-C domain-containing protein, partial [Neisseriaceae bacterium]|nr:SEC-C domain-containing protein [Neisseriaceae bacterium]
ADTEAYEFQNIYNLETVIIPTNLPMIRKDYNDQVFRTAEEKYEAVIADIKKCYENGQPVLVGTTSIETSELVSDLLNKERLPHNVLNAKEHEKEAYIVAQAGKPKMITVATNMAGRGTDIVLGGNITEQLKQIEQDETLSESEKQNKINQLKNEWERLHEQVIQAGGLHIIGTERHESRRIDNQLRGRSGRQGDPGSSRFYLSFEDQLLRLFALDRAAAIINRLAPERGVAIEHGMLTRQIEGAQRKVESRNFDIRKQLLEYDNVANDQRKVVYHIRNEILDGETTSNDIAQIRQDVIAGVCDDFIRPDTMEEEWDISGLEHTLAGEFGVTGVNIKEWLKADSSLDSDDIKQRIVDMVESDYAAKVDMVGADGMAGFERNVMLNVIDQKWREHLAQMDNLRQGIHLRGYAQKNPKQEYKREAFGMFQTFMSDIYRTATRYLTSVRIQIAPAQEEVPDNHADNAPPPPPVDDGEDYSIDALEARGIYITRNDPCPCGSGEKYKNCHGKLA